jgi:hypothetical protein
MMIRIRVIQVLILLQIPIIVPILVLSIVTQTVIAVQIIHVKRKKRAQTAQMYTKVCVGNGSIADRFL